MIKARVVSLKDQTFRTCGVTYTLTEGEVFTADFPSEENLKAIEELGVILRRVPENTEEIKPVPIIKAPVKLINQRGEEIPLSSRKEEPKKPFLQTPDKVEKIEILEETTRPVFNSVEEQVLNSLNRDPQPPTYVSEAPPIKREPRTSTEEIPIRNQDSNLPELKSSPTEIPEENIPILRETPVEEATTKELIEMSKLGIERNSDGSPYVSAVHGEGKAKSKKLKALSSLNTAELKIRAKEMRIFEVDGKPVDQATGSAIYNLLKAKQEENKT